VNPPTTSDTNGTSVSVSGSATVYAKVIGCPGYLDSVVGSATYTILPAPGFSVAGGIYGSPQTVTISGPVGATLWYNTTGTFTGCTYSSCATATQVTGTVSVATETLYAISTEAGYLNSSITSAAYTISALLPILTLTGPGSVMAGNTADLTISLSGSSGFNLAGVQWTFNLPTGWALGTPVISIPAAALGLGVSCGVSICIVEDTTSVVTMSDMALATIPVTVPSGASGSISLPITGLLGASGTGTVVSITPGAGYSITITALAIHVVAH
jgi:hypothetical protein